MMLFKKAFLLFNFIGLLLYKLFFADAVSVTQKLPASTEVGKEFVVELEINKGTTAGFAKLQQELPSGCTATVVDAASGNFSFADGTLKIIWMSLPPTASYKISYKVNVAKDAVIGQIDFGGKFAYLENNEKKTYQIPVSSVSIVTKDGAVVAATPAKSQEAIPVTSSTTETVVPATTTAATEAKPAESAPVNVTPSDANKTTVAYQNTKITGENGNVIVTREMPNIAAKDFVVNVTIKKGTVSGFAKFEETIPSGMTVVNIENASGVFSFVDNKVKYLWMSLPVDGEFKIAYKVSATPNFNGTTASIDGVFSFLENDETKKVMLAASGIQMGVDPASIPSAALAAAAAKPKENTTPTVTAAKTPAPSTVQSTATTNAVEEPSTPVAATTPTPAKIKPRKEAPVSTPNVSASNTVSGSIIFKVQVCATHKSVPNTFFRDNWSVNEEIESEMHEGWYKYITGKYNQYNQARDKRVELTSNSQIPGPFVTAYNSGNRITVQEALMIAGQRWIK